MPDDRPYFRVVGWRGAVLPCMVARPSRLDKAILPYFIAGMSTPDDGEETAWPASRR